MIIIDIRPPEGRTPNQMIIDPFHFLAPLRLRKK
jgi:hypothetical protein